MFATLVAPPARSLALLLLFEALIDRHGDDL